MYLGIQALYSKITRQILGPLDVSGHTGVYSLWIQKNKQLDQKHLPIQVIHLEAYQITVVQMKDRHIFFGNAAGIPAISDIALY